MLGKEFVSNVMKLGISKGDTIHAKNLKTIHNILTELTN